MTVCISVLWLLLCVKWVSKEELYQFRDRLMDRETLVFI